MTITCFASVHEELVSPSSDSGFGASLLHGEAPPPILQGEAADVPRRQLGADHLFVHGVAELIVAHMLAYLKQSNDYHLCILYGLHV